jgi:molybdopterin converting factor small subunit
MQITVKTDFDPNSEGTIVELEQKITLRDLLDDLSNKLHYPIIHPETGNIDSLLQVNVNDKDFYMLPNRLNTLLKDGDIIEIFIAVIAAGG